MGVKLQELVLREPINISELKGKIVAIDAPNIIFSLLNFSYKNKQFDLSNLMTDRTQRAISHLYGLLFRINFYYSKRMFPLFCFDGRDSELKRMVTKDHLHDFRVVKEWYQDAIHNGNKELARKLALGKEFLWPNIIAESKQLLHALGVPYLESPASAESQCAYLVKAKIAHYAVSQDFDSLLFGCPALIQNLSKSLRRKVQGKWMYNKVSTLKVDLEANLKRLRLDPFQLVDLAMLLGTDYNSGVKHIGPKTALELIKTYHNLESIIASQKKRYDFTHLTPENIQKIRKIFLNSDVLKILPDFYWDPPNRAKIIELMCEDHTLNTERVENNVQKVIKSYIACKDYFQELKPGPKIVQKTLL